MLGLAVPALAPAMHLSLSIKKYEPRRDLEELAPSRLLAGNEG